MAEAPPSELELLVVAGPERVLMGRAALIIGQIVLHAANINQIPVGRLVADFAHAKTKIELTESFSAMRIELGGAGSTAP